MKTLSRFLFGSLLTLLAVGSGASTSTIKPPLAPRAVGIENGGEPSRQYKRLPTRPDANKLYDCMYGYQEGGGCGSSGRPLIAQEITQLEGIEVIARRYRGGWNTACVGDECADVMDSVRVREMGKPQGVIQETVVLVSDIKDLKADACALKSFIPDAEARAAFANTTSKSSAEDKYAAALVAWGIYGGAARAASMYGPAHPINTTAYLFNGAMEFTMTYADGGSEVFFHVINGSSVQLVAEPKAGSAKEGDGESKCPG